MTLTRFFYSRKDGLLQPIITIGINIQNTWERTEVYVDSGATYSVFAAKTANDFDFDYRTGRRSSLIVGNGSAIIIYLHDLEIQLGKERFICPIGFSENLGVSFNVLGKTGIFDKFRICFQENQGIITFESR